MCRSVCGSVEEGSCLGAAVLRQSWAVDARSNRNGGNFERSRFEVEGAEEAGLAQLVV